MPAGAEQRGGLHAVPASGGAAAPEVLDRPPPGILRQTFVLRAKIGVQAKIAQAEEEMAFTFAHQMEEFLQPGPRLSVGRILRTEAAEGGRQGQGGDIFSAAGELPQVCADLRRPLGPQVGELRKSFFELLALVQKHVKIAAEVGCFQPVAGGAGQF